jgi:hypothetical protein
MMFYIYIVLLESDMHKVTFANVPLQVLDLDGQGAGEFCLEMDAHHLISSLIPSHKSEFDLTNRQVRKFTKHSSLRTIRVIFRKNPTIPDYFHSIDRLIVRTIHN